MAKPTVSSKVRTAATLLQYAENVLKKSKEHADLFPDAASTLDTLESAIQTYKNGLTEAAFRDIRQVVIKNQQTKALKQLLHKYALYIEMVSDGDPSIILAAGFIPSKSTTTTIGMSPRPNDLRVSAPHVGTNSVQLSVQAWKHAKYYQFEFRKLGSMNEWTRFMSTKSRAVLSGLDARVDYEFRVTYLGSDPTPNYSDTVHCFVV